MRKKIIDKIFEISKQPNAFELLEKFLSANDSKSSLSEQILEVGVMPEFFEHDSSEEKLWSKYSDILLAESFDALGLEAEVLRLRGNSADVFAKSKTYTIVGDAKCFRLSRTAKNQKDFKVKALDDWRREDTYAVLVGPLNQYPSDRSQIYQQAIDRNVTLLSYTHFKFLLDFTSGSSLEKLWEVGKRLKEKVGKISERRGKIYWEEIDKTLLEISGKDLNELKKYKLSEIDMIKKLGLEGINYWENKIKEFEKLTKEEAISLLVKAQKIRQKIQTIQFTMNRSVSLL